MKLAVHCAPLVNVWTPGWTAALSAGAQAPAAGTTSSSAQTAAASVTAACLRAFKVLPPAFEIVLRGRRPACLFRGLPDRKAGYATLSGRRAGKRVALGFDVVEQLLEGVGELLHALALERAHDVVVVDARLAQPLEEVTRAVDVALERRRHLAVVLEGGDRLRRHRVDGVGADQLLDVHRVAVALVLDRRRGPQAALRSRAGRPQGLPALAGEDLLEGLVGEARVGDGQAAAQVVVPAELVEALVGLGVHARDEERGNARDLRGVAAGLHQAL